jgi:predicted nucleic acid-binding protein
MGLSWEQFIPEGASVVVDSAPIIYLLEENSAFAAKFVEFFALVAAGRNTVVVSAVTLAEVLIGPLSRGHEALAKRYRHVLTESAGWQFAEMSADVAETAARFRARYKLKLPDAIQLATAATVGAYGLVTHDRDFGKFAEFPVLSG